MKKIMNRPETMVSEICKGIALAHPDIEFIEKYKVIKKKTIDPAKVSLLSGGGSGHEPAHAGFVGDGMLDAAVCGDIFASPSQIQVYNGIKEVATEAGVLLIIKNYSGDMMNFGNAAFLAREDGIRVDYVKVDDDIAVEDSLYTVGRRGVAGTLFVHKTAGAAAADGGTLERVKQVAEKAAANVQSIGFALTSCTVPAKGTPTFELKDDEIEFGVGIHGEPGIRRQKMTTADKLAKEMVAALIKSLKLKKGEEVAVLVNGFGGSPLGELYLLNNSVSALLKESGIVVYKTYVGNYMTSLDMAGASLSIMRLDDELKMLLAADSRTPAFTTVDFKPDAPVAERGAQAAYVEDVNHELELDSSGKKIDNERVTIQNIQYMVDTMSVSAIKNEVPFCELDSFAGDGDFGMSLAKGFKQLKKEWSEIVAHNSNSIGSFLDAASLVIMEHCGGASGPIWGSAFRAAGKAAKDKTELSLNELADVLDAAAKGIQAIGERSFGRGAVVGDKTLIDALIPTVESLRKSAAESLPFLDALRDGAKAACAGAKATEQLVARMGRAGTVGERSLGHPDAGAHGVGVIFTDIADNME